MKRFLCLAVLICFFLCGCGQTQYEVKTFSYTEDCIELADQKISILETQGQKRNPVKNGDDAVAIAKKHCLILISASIFAILFILCNKIGNPLCYMYINQYADFPLMVLCAISGTALIFIASKYLLFICKIVFLGDVVFWYSINSLTVFPIHLTIKVLSIPILSKLGLNNWVSLLVIMFIFTIPLVNVVTNYFPFMLGSFKHKQTRRIKT